MRVLVCGGRKFSDTTLAYGVLDQLARHQLIDCIIEGDAPGADRIAGYWAKKHRIDLLTFPADWTLGPAAGPIRNRQMVEQGKPDLVIAFAGGAGTRNMIWQAKRAGIPVVQINGEQHGRDL